jgi:hypothetical protein
MEAMSYIGGTSAELSPRDARRREYSARNLAEHLSKRKIPSQNEKTVKNFCDTERARVRDTPPTYRWVKRRNDELLSWGFVLSCFAVFFVVISHKLDALKYVAALFAAVGLVFFVRFAIGKKVQVQTNRGIERSEWRQHICNNAGQVPKEYSDLVRSALTIPNSMLFLYTLENCGVLYISYVPKNGPHEDGYLAYWS